MYKGFLLGSNGIRNRDITLNLDCHPIARNTNESNPIPASMRSIVFLGLAVLVCGSENSRYQFRVPPNKRGLSLTFPSHGSSSYSTPHLGIPSSVSSGYSLGGSSGGFSLGHAGLSLGGSIGHRIAYSQPSTGGLGSGYVSSGPDHNSLNLQGASLNGHSAQSTYSVPSITSIGLGSGGGSNLISSKTGPVTFGSQSGSDAASSSYSGSGSGSYSSAPVYATAAQGLSAYNNGGSTVPVVLGSSHGSSSSYSLPTQSISSNSLHSVTGGLIIASGSHDGSSSYSLPVSKPSYSISALSSSSGSHGASPTYSLPITSGPHEISALSSSSSSPSYSAPVSSGSYSSSNSHAGFSTSASDSSNYEPISSGSYSNSGSSSSSYVNYLPSHSSGSSSSYSSPSVIYGSPSSSSSGYSDSGSSYAVHSSSYASPSHSYSNPVVTHAKASSYTPTYLSPSGSYGTSTGSHGAYSSVQSPRYSRLAAIKSYDNAQLESEKYDTISYSIPNGK
ncbi:LOW QUALITY PROTEIN: uncharacterized protein DDB_G0271670 [Polyergus mexicanus]|uniref:LOW QUALITY PROTEIN: uncharacterized protein DDB_G0271670 n=1 Tax=Polyergus mexicanus TaxID=615972 RepID=UPI0038B4F582